MKEKIKTLHDEILKKLETINTTSELNDLKVEYFGKKGPIVELGSVMGSLTIEEKKEVGMLLNNLKVEVTELMETKKTNLEELELSKKLEKEAIDI